MLCARFRCMGALLVLLMVPLTAAGQTASPEDSPTGAIQALKDTADPEKNSDKDFRSRLERARRYIAANRTETLGAVVSLLDENNTQIRLNAAIALAELATQAKPDAELLKALHRCLRDTNPAIRYWGMQGLTATPMPEAEKVAAISECIGAQQPRELQAAAVYTAERANVKEAIPLIVDYMQRLLPDYKAAVARVMTIEEKAIAPADGLTEVPVIPAPIPEGPRTTRPGVTSRAVTPEEPRSSPIINTTEAAGTPRRVDPDKMETPEAVEALILMAQQERVIQYLHQAGFVLENLVQTRPLESPFNFDATAPWELDQCVALAVAWLQKNRAQFKLLNEPAAQPAPEKTAAPAAAPAAETKPVP